MELKPSTTIDTVENFTIFELYLMELKPKQFYVTSGQIADAINDEAVLDADSEF